MCVMGVSLAVQLDAAQMQEVGVLVERRGEPGDAWGRVVNHS